LAAAGLELSAGKTGSWPWTSSDIAVASSSSRPSSCHQTTGCYYLCCSLHTSAPECEMLQVASNPPHIALSSNRQRQHNIVVCGCGWNTSPT
jgi:hypothetical protein